MYLVIIKTKFEKSVKKDRVKEKKNIFFGFPAIMLLIQSILFYPFKII